MNLTSPTMHTLSGHNLATIQLVMEVVSSITFGDTGVMFQSLGLESKCSKIKVALMPMNAHFKPTKRYSPIASDARGSLWVGYACIRQQACVTFYCCCPDTHGAQSVCLSPAHAKAFSLSVGYPILQRALVNTLVLQFAVYDIAAVTTVFEQDPLCDPYSDTVWRGRIPSSMAQHSHS